MIEDGKMRWFGKSWNAPINEECEQQPVPVDELCIYCDGPIGIYAVGVTMICVTTADDNWDRRPAHLLCLYRTVVGNYDSMWFRSRGPASEAPPSPS